MKSARPFVTGLPRDGAEPIVTAEVEQAMYLAARKRRRVAENQRDPRHVSAAAIEALIGIGNVIVGLMEGLTVVGGLGGGRVGGTRTVEQAARVMEWDVGVARRGLAMLDADLSGYLCSIERDESGAMTAFDWLDLEPAEIAAGIRDLDGVLKEEYRGGEGAA